MTLFNACRDFSTWVCKHYAQDHAKGLIHLSALGWLFSSLAQIGMIKTNKDISPEKKKFLIPQEMADCALNVSLLYTICEAVKKYADGFIENGKYYTPLTQEIVKEIQPTTNATNSFVKGICDDLYSRKLIDAKNSKQQVSDFYNGLIKFMESFGNADITRDTDFETLKKFKGVIKDIEKYKLYDNRNALIQQLKKGQTEFTGYKGGVGTIAVILASVLASSIITPIVRNEIANKSQKKAIKKELPKKELSKKELISNYNWAMSQISPDSPFIQMKI